jgi:hypothetical protein
MSQVSTSSSRTIAASPRAVYSVLADYVEHHPHILPPSITDLVVEEGGLGEGTVIRFAMTTAGRTQQFRQRVAEPEPGRVLQEIDMDGDVVTTFTVDPAPSGCTVTIMTTWPARGVQGLVERFVAPRLLRKQYDKELARLDTYVRKGARS